MAIVEVEKLWGSEQWLHNGDDYCAKLLFLNHGFQCSLHYHPVKRESFICVAGKVRLEVLQNDGHIQNIYLQPYQHYTLEPGKAHRFRAITPTAVIVEASTKHSDSDVVRLEDSRAC